VRGRVEEGGRWRNVEASTGSKRPNARVNSPIIALLRPFICFMTAELSVFTIFERRRRSLAADVFSWLFLSESRLSHDDRS